MEKWGNKEKYTSTTNVNWFRRFYLTLYMVFLLPSCFRFYDVDNVTTTGQTVIKSTVDNGNIKYNKRLLIILIDSNIYIDTDSVFFSFPLMDKRIKDWKEQDQDTLLDM